MPHGAKEALGLPLLYTFCAYAGAQTPASAASYPPSRDAIFRKTPCEYPLPIEKKLFLQVFALFFLFFCCPPEPCADLQDGRYYCLANTAMLQKELYSLAYKHGDRSFPSSSWNKDPLSRTLPMWTATGKSQVNHTTAGGILSPRLQAIQAIV